jgi:hypothetical protein
MITSSLLLPALLFCNAWKSQISSMVPKKVPITAPANVPPEYWPEQDGWVTMVVVACRATSAGDAKRCSDTSVVGGAWSSISIVLRSRVHLSHTIDEFKTVCRDASETELQPRVLLPTVLRFELSPEVWPEDNRTREHSRLSAGSGTGSLAW